MTDTFLKVELKFCECCGGLWLRREGSTQVYCVECLPVMREVARGKKKQPKTVKAFMQPGDVVCA